MASMTAMTTKPFLGSRLATSPRQALQAAVPRSRQAVVTRAGYLGSTTNLIFIASTTAFLTAGRFGLAPTAKKHTKAGLKLYDEDSEGLTTSDPGGYTAVDVLVGGSQGHVVAVGVVLGLRAIGMLA